MGLFILFALNRVFSCQCQSQCSHILASILLLLTFFPLLHRLSFLACFLVLCFHSNPKCWSIPSPVLCPLTLPGILLGPYFSLPSKHLYITNLCLCMDLSLDLSLKFQICIPKFLLKISILIPSSHFRLNMFKTESLKYHMNYLLQTNLLLNLSISF